MKIGLEGDWRHPSAGGTVQTKAGQREGGGYERDPGGRGARTRGLTDWLWEWGRGRHGEVALMCRWLSCPCVTFTVQCDLQGLLVIGCRVTKDHKWLKAACIYYLTLSMVQDASTGHGVLGSGLPKAAIKMPAGRILIWKFD